MDRIHDQASLVGPQTALSSSNEPEQDLSKQVLKLNRDLAHMAARGRWDTPEARVIRENLESLNQQRSATNATKKEGLTRDIQSGRDFFLADLFIYATKCDGASMEAPIFTLSTKPDLRMWEWRSKDGKKYVKVIPSILGRATQHDKDVLIYIVSQSIEGLNRGREDARGRTVRFTVHDFLLATNRQTSGVGYRRLREAFERLRGTSITTDIRTGGRRIRKGFGIIDSWTIVEKSPTDERMIAVEVTLSEWIYNSVQAFEVLTIHPDYFRLRKPLARRLYEIARKHCGRQREWTISLELLKEKAGSRSATREFRRALRVIQAEDCLPEYWVCLGDGDLVSFASRDLQKAVPLVRAFGRKKARSKAGQGHGVGLSD